jgi:hypothetical protein
MRTVDNLDCLVRERIERELYGLREAEQSTLLRVLALPPGHDRSQAFAEYWNASAAIDAFAERQALWAKCDPNEKS